MWNLVITGFLCSVAIPLMVEAIYYGSHNCRKDQWQCKDGSCISFDGHCDGVVDCPDGSDETYPLCRNTLCQDNLFRCTYGACVDSTAPCNGVKDCADNSDELMLRCQNKTRIKDGKFQCDDGFRITVTELCDGAPDCADGSDETVAVCTGVPCDPYLFQCAYGACVDQDAMCDDTQHCVDNSDESDEMCNRVSVPAVKKPAAPIVEAVGPRVSQGTGDCVLPPYPDNGRYDVLGDDAALPGDRFQSAIITINCDPGYSVNGRDNATCIAGFGFKNIPKCMRYCDLKPHASVEYTCVTQDEGGSHTRPCGEREFPGTEVEPHCRMNYRGSPSHMTCREDGTWTHVAICKPECGTITPTGNKYIIGGQTADHGQLPWHSGIYTKTTTPYQQICGGSLATTTTIITAAHCFYDEEPLPASDYAVALGKVYRPWNHPRDSSFVQKSNVSKIYIEDKFHGAKTNFQSDIAIVILETEIVLQTYIRPVCVNFEEKLDKLQLQAGKEGTIAGWGLTAANGDPSEILKVVKLPYVTDTQCYKDSPSDFHEYITFDKFCAGFLDGSSALCQGDSGGGLAFPEMEMGVKRFYLRGIVSTAPRNEQVCDPNARTTFTGIMHHKRFINKHVNFNA